MKTKRDAKSCSAVVTAAPGPKSGVGNASMPVNTPGAGGHTNGVGVPSGRLARICRSGRSSVEHTGGRKLPAPTPLAPATVSTTSRKPTPSTHS